MYWMKNSRSPFRSRNSAAGNDPARVSNRGLRIAGSALVLGSAFIVIGFIGGIWAGQLVGSLPGASRGVSFSELLTYICLSVIHPTESVQAFEALFHLPSPASCSAWLYAYAPAWPWFASGGAAMLGVAGCMLGAWLEARQSGVRSIRGRRLAVGIREAIREYHREVKTDKPGVKIHPEVRITRERETRGIAYIGSQGGGKTVSIETLLSSIIARGDRVLIYDNKGDFSSRIASVPGAKGNYGILGPWDSRSMRWEVAADIKSKAAAREFASRLIPEGGDGPWAAGSSSILAGLIITLATEKKSQWSWADLMREVSNTDYETFRLRALAGGPEAALMLPENPTVTTISFLSNLSAHVGGLVSDMSTADDEAARRGAQRWSARAWMRGEIAQKIVLLQGNSDFSLLSRGVHAAIITNAVSSRSWLKDSSERRIWIVLDEFADLGKIDAIGNLAATGRSKGICLVIGTQSIQQVREVYGRDWSDGLSGLFGTWILCRTQGPETQRWSSDLVGTQTVVRRVRSASESGDASGNLSDQIAEEDLISPNEWGELGRVRKIGIRAALLTGGPVVSVVTWPWSGWKTVDEGWLPAAWTHELSYEGKRKSVGKPGLSEECRVQVAQTAKYEEMVTQPDLRKEFSDQTQVAVPQVDKREAIAQEDGEECDSSGLDEALQEKLTAAIIDAILPGASTVIEVGDAVGEQAGSDEDGAPAQPLPEEKLRRRRDGMEEGEGT